jgi:hypothetical protein
MDKRYMQNIVIAFAVMIVLLRPFCVYHLSAAPGFPKEPSKVVRLLQGLVKKKNDHAADTGEVIELSTSKKFIPLQAVFSLLFNKMLWLLSLLFGLGFIVRRKSIFDISHSNHYNQFICRFQI